MGYIAYASGTLIIAVLIHSIYTKRIKAREDEKAFKHGTEVTEKTVLEDEHTSQNQEKGQNSTTPSVAIEVSGDGNTGIKDKPSRSVDMQKEDATQSAMNGHAKPLNTHSMPPPPLRPSSAPNLDSPASIARQRTAMGPPSSLPPSRSRSPPRLKPATVSSLAPTPRLAVPNRQPQAASSSSKQMLAPPQSAAASLRVPQQKVLTNTRMQPRSSLDPNALTTSTQAPGKRPSRKVILSPGHSPLDWAALTKSTSPDATTKLRGTNASTVLGPFRLGRITPSQLKAQTGRRGKDAWTVYQGKVYNITAYLDFHPGGRDELMKGAGRSSDNLFAEVHPWVNWEGMLSGCLVGLLVGEDDPGAMGREADAANQGEQETVNELDEMD